MPEYPEMAHYRQIFEERLVGLEISQVEVNRDKSVNMPAEQFKAGMERRRIVKIGQRGKQLVFYLSSQQAGVVHLMLGGWMYYSTEEQSPDRTKQLIIHFTERHENLYFINLRLGYFHLLTMEEWHNQSASLGPDVLDERLTFPLFIENIVISFSHYTALGR